MIAAEAHLIVTRPRFPGGGRAIRGMWGVFILAVATLHAGEVSAAGVAERGLSQGTLVVREDRIEGEVSFDWHDLLVYFPLDTDGDDQLSDEEFGYWQEGLGALAETFYGVWLGEDADPRSLHTVRVHRLPGDERITFTTSLAVPGLLDAGALDVAFVAHREITARHHLRVLDGEGRLLLEETFLGEDKGSREENPRRETAARAELARAETDAALVRAVGDPGSRHRWAGVGAVLTLFLILATGWAARRQRSVGWKKVRAYVSRSGG